MGCAASVPLEADLRQAAISGNLKTVLRLLKTDVDVNHADEVNRQHESSISLRLLHGLPLAVGPDFSSIDLAK